MARRRKSKNDITKYVIIGIVVLVLLFLVMNVNPTGKFTAPGEDMPEPGSGFLIQEESGELRCYTFDSYLTEHCKVETTDFSMPEDPCSCLPDREAKDIEAERGNLWEPDQPGEEAPVEDEPIEPSSASIY